MTPGARVSAAIDTLDAVLGGDPAEKALTNWARKSRFAGSKDRAAVRDLVFQALRCRDSYAALGGGLSGRQIMIGSIRASGDPLDDLFNGAGYAPAALTEAEMHCMSHMSDPAPYDLPDWLVDVLQHDLGDAFSGYVEALKSRAPLFLRVNSHLGCVDDLIASLAKDNIDAAPVDGCDTAVIVHRNPRKVSASHAYLGGLCEVQDLSSQRIVKRLPLASGMRVLDYCAGGGGKSLAMAARLPRNDIAVFAHDISTERMRDLPDRARRAGVSIPELTLSQIAQTAPFDLILVDAPCSGSGTWRRTPDSKWRCTADGIEALNRTQADILENACQALTAGGCLAYATCSVLTAENEDRVHAFLHKHDQFELKGELRLHPETGGGDGFYLALMQHRI